MFTYICRDSTNAAETTEAAFILVGDEAAEHCVDVERRFVYGQIVEGKPKAGNPIGRMKVNLIDNACLVTIWSVADYCCLSRSGHWARSGR